MSGSDVHSGLKVVDVVVDVADRYLGANAILPLAGHQKRARSDRVQKRTSSLSHRRPLRQFSQLQTAMTNELAAPNGAQEKEPQQHPEGEEDNDEVEEDGPVEASGAGGE